MVLDYSQNFMYAIKNLIDTICVYIREIYWLLNVVD